jgi:hypothetical protein
MIGEKKSRDRQLHYVTYLLILLLGATQIFYLIRTSSENEKLKTDLARLSNEINQAKSYSVNAVNQSHSVKNAIDKLEQQINNLSKK